MFVVQTFFYIKKKHLKISKILKNKNKIFLISHKKRHGVLNINLAKSIFLVLRSDLNISFLRAKRTDISFFLSF